MALGETVFIHLSLPDSEHGAVGKVVWVTPRNSCSDRKAGIGVDFTEAETGMLAAINRLLTDSAAGNGNNGPCATF